MSSFDLFWNSLDNQWKEIISVNHELENKLTVEQRKMRSFWISPLENYKKIIGKDIPVKIFDTILDENKIDIFGTSLNSITPLKNFQRLKEFYCGSTQVSDLEPLRNLHSLEKLCCYNTPVINLEPLANVLSLKRICLSGTKIKSLDPLRNLINLEKMSIYRTDVEDLEPISNLRNLTKINFNFTKVSSLLPLYNLINLREIHCYKTHVSVEELILFQEHNKVCKCINMYEQPEDEYDDFV